MRDQRIAPRDPIPQREALYILVDKPVGGGGSDAEANRFPVFLNDERLVTFAKIVGGVQDENILQMLQTAKGFRRLVHSIGVSIVSDAPDKAAVFSMYFSGEHGTEGGSGKISLCTNGVETILEMACVEEQDTDAVPGKFLIELPCEEDTALVTVKFYLHDGYHAPRFDPDPPVEFDTPQYNAMIARSCLSTGNNARIKRVLEDLRAGKPVTLAFLGGSITQGAGAIPEQEKCYARLTFEAIRDKYSSAPDQVNYIKAGVGGTPSQLALNRYDRDVTRNGTVSPDLVVVEFAVNDLGDETNGCCYESLVHRIWNDPGEPAVILLFSVFANDWNLKERLAPVGWRHELPMVDVLEAVSPQFGATAAQRSVITKRQYFYDTYHPSNAGHRIMKDCLMYLLQRLDAQQSMAPAKEAPPYYSFYFSAMEAYDRSNLPLDISVDPGSFTGTDEDLQMVALDNDTYNTAQFPFNWKKSSGKKPFQMELVCKSLQMVFKDSASLDFGRIRVTVDGQTVAYYDPREVGWTHCHATILFAEETAGKHHIEICMAPEDEGKTFTILGFGVVR